MIAIGYFDGTKRRGLLVWTESDGARHAIGGYDPGDEATAIDPQTVVTTDASERVLAGWVHPDNIREINGVADLPGFLSQASLPRD